MAFSSRTQKVSSGSTSRLMEPYLQPRGHFFDAIYVVRMPFHPHNTHLTFTRGYHRLPRFLLIAF